MISYFTYRNRFLSNFHPAMIFYEGLWYPTVEHAYQASKSTDQEYRKEISELPVKRAGKAKRKGREVRLRPEWDEIFKLDMMEKFLRLKFKDGFLAKKLLETDPQELVEGNQWHDNYWGNCFCDNCDTLGRNMLGKLLMKIREDMKNENNNNG